MDNVDPKKTSSADDLQENTGEIAEEARTRMADIDREFNSRIDDLGSRVTQSRSRADKMKPESNNASGMTPEDAKGLGTGLTAAYALIGTPVILYFIGFAIDRAMGRTEGQVQFAPIAGFIGFLLGLAFTVIIANRNNK